MARGIQQGGGWAATTYNYVSGRSTDHALLCALRTSLTPHYRSALRFALLHVSLKNKPYLVKFSVFFQQATIKMHTPQQEQPQFHTAGFSGFSGFSGLNAVQGQALPAFHDSNPYLSPTREVMGLLRNNYVTTT